MKFFTLFAAAVLTATSALAANHDIKSLRHATHNKLSKTAVTAPTDSKLAGIETRQLDLAKIKASAQRLSRDAKDQSIYEVEGEAKNYILEGLGFQNTWIGLMYDSHSSMTEVVWGDNGDVYIKDIFSIGFDSYVMGTYADGKITIDLPQQIGYYAEEDEGEFYEESYYVTIVNITEDRDLINSDATSIVLDVDEDGSIYFDLDPEFDINGDGYPSSILGFVIDDTTPGKTAQWAGYGDNIQIYTPFDGVAVTLPEGLEPESWVAKFTDDYGDDVLRVVSVAIDGDKIYLGDMQEDVMDMWVVGTISGDKVTFASGQYMGYVDYYMVPIYFLTGIPSIVYDEEYDEDVLDVEFTESIVFDYDKDAKTLVARDNKAIVLNGDPDELYYLECWIDPEIYMQDPAMCNAAPLDPYVMRYEPWSVDNFGGQGEIIWWIPAENVNGALLDTDRMYYNLYVDGEIFAIDPEEYPFVEEYMEDIPYNYTDGYDISVFGEEHDIWFYFEGAETIGLQSFFVGYDDVVYSSNLVEFICTDEEEDPGEENPGEEDPGTTGIHNVTLVPVVSSEYFDLTGRKVENPTAGMYIKSMRTADGTIRNIKVMVK